MSEDGPGPHRPPHHHKPGSKTLSVPTLLKAVMAALAGGVTETVGRLPCFFRFNRIRSSSGDSEQLSTASVKNKAASLPFEFSRAICSPWISALAATTGWMLSCGCLSGLRMLCRSFLAPLYCRSLALTCADCESTVDHSSHLRMKLSRRGRLQELAL
jgi:hypothetical protein